MGKKIEEYSRNCIWGLLIILLFISPLTVGAGEILLQSEQTASKTARDKLRTRISLSCINTPIDKVLMELSEKAEIDIVKSPRVVGDVTVKVTDVPLGEALTNILSLYHFTYIATENMIRVVPLPPNAKMKEPQVTRIYRLTYADAEEVYAALDKFVSGKGEVGFNKSTSHIVVTDTEDKIRAIDKFIEQVDRITPQVLVEVRIYDVTTREGFELDPQWRLGRNAPFTGNISHLKEITETTRGPESSFREEFRKDIQWEQRPPPNNPITHYPDPNWSGSQFGNIFGIAERDEKQWTKDPGRTNRDTTWVEPGMMTDWRRKPFVGGSFDRITGGTLSFSVLNDAVDIDLALTILHSQVEARLLANPRILVLDNETANFEIVREIPYRGIREVPREDPITYTAFKNVGVDLKVTPHIARNGFLRLHIVPKFSVLVGQGMGGLPTIDSRFVDTKAMIRDGQTIAIGGLRKREITKDIARVPVLCDLPLVGGLFISETESVAINELIVFITTTIVTEPTLSEAEKKLFDETEFTTPEIGKTRIEKGDFEIPEIENGGFGNTKVDKPDITDSLELLLKKLGPPSD
ncbi:MAG: hypothetical protein FVQ85_17975 [Planctomycetes bacterium]|nr:hypothetical protein [Planctomycetota bacterium]